jgi:hypothetical protein
MVFGLLEHKQPARRSAARAKAVLVYGKGASGVGSNVIGHGDTGQRGVVCEGVVCKVSRGAGTAGPSTTLLRSSGPSTAGRDDDNSIAVGSGEGPGGSSAPPEAGWGSGQFLPEAVGGRWIARPAGYASIRRHRMAG